MIFSLLQVCLQSVVVLWADSNFCISKQDKNLVNFQELRAVLHIMCYVS